MANQKQQTTEEVKNQAKQAKNEVKNQTDQAKKAMGRKDVMTGTLVGGVIGAATSLLLAPKTGKELRSDISNQTTSVVDKSKQIGGSTKTKFTDLKNSTAEKSQKITSKFKKSNKEDATQEENEQQSSDNQQSLENDQQNENNQQNGQSSDEEKQSNENKQQKKKQNKSKAEKENKEQQDNAKEGETTLKTNDDTAK